MTSYKSCISLVIIAALSACSTNGGRGDRAPRGGAGGPFGESGGAGPRTARFAPIADPGGVAARDIAFAKAARETGQWTAFREFAAPNAVFEGVQGSQMAASDLLFVADPARSMDWTPRRIWSSCDGSLAVSFGRYMNAENLVGDYVTAWERKGREGYRWTYTIRALDDPQPAAREAVEVPEEGNVILVDAFDGIEGKTADCPRTGLSEEGARFAETPLEEQASPDLLGEGAINGSVTMSDDGTLQWSMERGADGSRKITISYLRNGEWEEVLDFSAPPS